MGKVRIESCAGQGDPVHASGGTLLLEFAVLGLGAVQDALLRCKMGPRSAKVTSVTVISEIAAAVTDFEILPGL